MKLYLEHERTVLLVSSDPYTQELVENAVGIDKLWERASFADEAREITSRVPFDLIIVEDMFSPTKECFNNVNKARRQIRSFSNHEEPLTPASDVIWWLSRLEIRGLDMLVFDKLVKNQIPIAGFLLIEELRRNPGINQNTAILLLLHEFTGRCLNPISGKFDQMVMPGHSGEMVARCAQLLKTG